ncbi:DUF895 domain membrane protein [Allomyces javanicus]|nr:DUF895 domain membrane protein [Allomyces javanicus]
MADSEQHGASSNPAAAAPAAPTASGFASTPSTPATERSGMIRVALLGFGFLLVFTAFNGAQTLVTTIHPENGFNSLATIYLCFFLGSLIAPSLVSRIPLRFIFFVAAAMYALFIAGLNWGTAALFITSALVGFAAGSIWITQGFYVSMASQASGVPIGKLTSVFLFIFTINMIAGNAISASILLAGISYSTLLYILAIVAATGALCLLLLPQPGRAATDTTTNAAPTMPLGEKLRMTIKLFPEMPMLALIPLILWNGALGSLAFGNIPRFLPESMVAARPEIVPLIFIVYGVTGTLASPFWGRVYDRSGPKPLVWAMAILGTVTYALVLVVLLVVPGLADDETLAIALFACATGALGALDNLTNSLINFSISSLYPDEQTNAAAFAVYRLCFCVGFILLSLLSNTGIWQIIVVLNVILLVATVAAYAYLIKYRHRKGAEQAVVDKAAGKH